MNREGILRVRVKGFDVTFPGVLYVKLREHFPLKVENKANCLIFSDGRNNQVKIDQIKKEISLNVFDDDVVWQDFEVKIHAVLQAIETTLGKACLLEEGGLSLAYISRVEKEQLIEKWATLDSLGVFDFKATMILADNIEVNVYKKRDSFFVKVIKVTDEPLVGMIEMKEWLEAARGELQKAYIEQLIQV